MSIESGKRFISDRKNNGLTRRPQTVAVSLLIFIAKVIFADHYYSKDGSKTTEEILERRLYNFLVYYIHLCTVHVIRNVRLKSIFGVIKQAKFRKDFKFWRDFNPCCKIFCQLSYESLERFSKTSCRRLCVERKFQLVKKGRQGRLLKRKKACVPVILIIYVLGLLPVKFWDQGQHKLRVCLCLITKVLSAHEKFENEILPISSLNIFLKK